ncbi:MAG: amidohydrolase family protein [Planctomycetes bacterium]|nr:amidohydrolase family protein [Planctomycetota bacterium]
MFRIDAHLHFNANTPESLAVLEKYDLKLLNICVATDNKGKWRSQAEMWSARTRENPKRFAWITSFDLPRFDDPHYADAEIENVRRDLSQRGAVGVKIWKNIGMEVKKPDRSWCYVDDPIFTPIVEAIERSGKTLLMHIAEPLGCWQPLKEGTPHYGYYKNHPEWHMYNKPEFASHARLMESRDSLVARHPKLRMIGAHFGSLEYDVVEMAKRFEKYPNFGVDTSARLGDLLLQDSKKVRQFFLDFQDRILYGTDYVNTEDQKKINPEVVKNGYSYFRLMTDQWWDYLTKSGTVKINDKEVQALGLPATVLDKVYFKNAQQWYPDI